MGGGKRRLAKGERVFTHENGLFKCRNCQSGFYIPVSSGRRPVCSVCGSVDVVSVQQKMTAFAVWPKEAFV